jgi:TonB family protein
METERRSFVPLIVGAVALVVAGGAAVHLFASRGGAEQAPAQIAPAEVAQSPPQAPAQTPAPAAQPPAPPVANRKAADTNRAAASAVIHEEIPKVPRSARETIHGRIRVTVRVTVDRSGAVVDEVLTEPGPSRYFARLATQAARKWKFAPADGLSARQWLVRFEFSREETTGHAVRPRSE